MATRQFRSKQSNAVTEAIKRTSVLAHTQTQAVDPTALQRVIDNAATALPADILAFQQTYGNRALSRLLANQQIRRAPSTAMRRGLAVHELHPTVQRNGEEDEPEPPKFLSFRQAYYEEGPLVGNRFTLDVEIDSPSTLYWRERTNRPYVGGMEPDVWNDMYSLVPGSEVFEDWQAKEQQAGRQRITFTDPPAMRKEANGTRELEFYILIVGGPDDRHQILFKAKQKLFCDPTGQLDYRRSSFTISTPRISTEAEFEPYPEEG